ncbi:MAG: bifunctional DNA primase/polymerase [Gemmataceae bacterium]
MTPNIILGRALDALQKGYGCIPVRAGSKVPAMSWKPFQDKLPTEDQLREWFKDPHENIALITSGLVVFDCDDPAMMDRVIAECGDTPYRVRTPRGGVHLGYRARRGVTLGNHVDVKGLTIDIRTNGGIALLPPSRTENGDYRWLSDGLPHRNQLPIAQIGWLRERKRKVESAIIVTDSSNAAIRARAYLQTIEPAVSGQRGHDRMFRVACVLVNKFGLSWEMAWPLFVEFNQKNLPPFSERELTHKLRDAVRKTR